MASVRFFPSLREMRMRLFTAIDLPPAVLRNLARLVDRLRPYARLRWQPADNFHITTKFIGEWPEQRLEEITEALRRLPARSPFRVAVRGLGWFPNERAPRVFWTGVEAEAGLAELARETEDALSELGVGREGRPFAPHLTLARVKERVPLEALKRVVAELPSREFGEFTVESFFLYLSELRPQGSVYTKLQEFPFRR